MTYKNVVALLSCLLLASCFSEKTGQEVVETKSTVNVRKDIKDWINDEFAGQKDLVLAVKDLASTPPESCQFKHKVECIEKLVGFDKALEIELEMMKRLLNTPERQKRFDQNIEKCHFGKGMNKQVCAFEKEER